MVSTGAVRLPSPKKDVRFLKSTKDMEGGTKELRSYYRGKKAIAQGCKLMRTNFDGSQSIAQLLNEGQSMAQVYACAITKGYQPI